MGDDPSRRLPLGRRIKKAGVRLFAGVVVPALYRAWMWLVTSTSRIDLEPARPLLDRLDAGGSAVVAVLHQDVICAPWFFRGRGMHAVASIGDAGEVISGTLTSLGFVALRGGSSSRASRRTPVLLPAVRALRRASDASVVVTPDGSRGPAGAIKPGVAMIAVASGAPVYCLLAHASRAIYLPTWDRTTFPLPFGEIRVTVEGPMQARGVAEVEALRARVEQALHRMHAEAFGRHGHAPVPALERYAEERP